LSLLVCLLAYRYNLCPSEACHPVDGSAGTCLPKARPVTSPTGVHLDLSPSSGGGDDATAVDEGDDDSNSNEPPLPPQQQQQQAQPRALIPVEFFPLHDVPAEAVRDGLKIVRSAKMDVAGVE
jgi:hypothetical protein